MKVLSPTAVCEPCPGRVVPTARGSHVLGGWCPQPGVDSLLAFAWRSGAGGPACPCPPTTWALLHLDSRCGESTGVTKGNAQVVQDDLSFLLPYSAAH